MVFFDDLGVNFLRKKIDQNLVHLNLDKKMYWGSQLELI